MMQKAYDQALKYLARREHSVVELTQKLQKKGFSTTVIASTIEELQENGAQSNYRFCESVIRTYTEKGYGPRYLRYRLQQSGISQEMIEQVFSDLNIHWEQLLEKIHRRHTHAEQNELGSSKEKQTKYIQYLLRRGFDYDLIRAVIFKKMVELADEIQ